MINESSQIVSCVWVCVCEKSKSKKRNAQDNWRSSEKVDILLMLFCWQRERMLLASIKRTLNNPYMQLTKTVQKFTVYRPCNHRCTFCFVFQYCRTSVANASINFIDKLIFIALFLLCCLFTTTDLCLRRSTSLARVAIVQLVKRFTICLCLVIPLSF